MSTINCLIVDDEELARSLIDNYVARLPDWNTVAQCSNPLEAMSILREQAVDVIFLDIQMPELSGVDFLKTMTQKPLVIFTTAYPEYALEGYQLDVIDYLLKPISFERFIKATQKAEELLTLKRGAQNQTAVPETKDYLLVKSEHKVHKIKLSDIHYIQSMREYVAYHTPNGRILSLHSLKKLEVELPSDRFLRIHKSYIIPIDRVKTLEGNLLHLDEVQLPIGANYRESVLKKIF